MHPIIEATRSVRASLKDVADANPVFMSTGDKETALREIVAAEAQLAELRLRVMVDSADVAEGTAAHDVAGWLAAETRVRLEGARADQRLATALDRSYAALAEALREGAVTKAQAAVVARCLEALPDGLDPDVVTRAEAAMIEHAGRFGPRELGRLGRHILRVVAPEEADAAEERALADAEAHAATKTRLNLRRLGDGTTRIWGRLPDLAATRLATYLEAFTNPRLSSSEPTSDPVDRLPYPRRLGEAFCDLLEAVDPARLPVHGGDATTLVVTIGLDRLTRALGTAEVLGGLVPGDEASGWEISASEARRLACQAQILPMVLGGDSQPLDLGRSRRLFTAGQRKALLVRDRTCRAEGCDQPGAWCEAHHLDPWSSRGRTDLANGLLLCRHHHHRAHDPAYSTQRLPNGDLRYHRRR